MYVSLLGTNVLNAFLFSSVILLFLGWGIVGAALGQKGPVWYVILLWRKVREATLESLWLGIDRKLLNLALPAARSG